MSPEPNETGGLDRTPEKYEPQTPNRSVPTEIEPVQPDTPQSPAQSERTGPELPVVNSADVQKREEARRKAWQAEHEQEEGK